jgi:hypothetical protein
MPVNRTEKQVVGIPLRRSTVRALDEWATTGPRPISRTRLLVLLVEQAVARRLCATAADARRKMRR